MGRPEHVGDVLERYFEAWVAELEILTKGPKMNDANKPKLPADYQPLAFGPALEHLMEQAERMNPTAVFLVAVWQEIERARLLFPEPNGTMAALAEETGELAKAMLGQSFEKVGKEAIQVACVAARIATEGDPTLDATRRANGLQPSAR